MPRNIIEYYPPVIRNIKDIQEIAKAENIEFDKLSQSITNVINDMFVQTASETGVEQFEKLLGIVKKPEWDLQTRKLNIAAKLNAKKMSISELKKLITEYEEDIVILLYNEKLEMVVGINIMPESKLKMLYNVIDDSIPLNIFYSISATGKKQTGIYKAIINRITPKLIMHDTGLNISEGGEHA